MPAEAQTATRALGAERVGWQAELNLRFAQREGRTYLAHRRHVGPLLVQRPFHPEGAPCHTYIVHPPGGVVGGDCLSVNVEIDTGAHALLTTPAATKFYRTESAIARQSQQILCRGAVEWLPQETIYYRGAIAHCSTRVCLEPTATFIGWEIPCLGLPSRGEPFATGSLTLNLELWVGKTPLFIDRLRIDGERQARTARWGLAAHHALGTLLAYPADPRLLDAVRGSVASQQLATTLVDGVLVCRLLAHQAEPIKNEFVRVWQALRPLMLDRAAVLPRIWAT